MNMLRHYGLLKNTGGRVLVVFMQLPDDKENCLVLSLDSMNDIVRDEIRELIDSKECQTELDLSKFLARKTLRAGEAGMSALMWLHSRNFLFKAPITNVTMTPNATVRINLADLLQQMADLNKDNTKSTEVKQESTNAAKPISEDSIREKIVQLRLEADTLEKQANTLIKDIDKMPKVKEETQKRKYTKKK